MDSNDRLGRFFNERSHLFGCNRVVYIKLLVPETLMLMQLLSWKENGLAAKTVSLFFISKESGVYGYGMLSATSTCSSSSTKAPDAGPAFMISSEAVSESGSDSIILGSFAA